MADDKMKGKDEPSREAFSTEAEMLARAEALRAGGFTIVPLDNPGRGMRGFIAFLERPDGAPDEPWDDQAVLLEWPVFGRPLEQEETEVLSSEALLRVYGDHGGHPSLRPYSDPMARAVGVVCHCRASEGKSLVFRVPLSALKALPKELLERLVSPTVPPPGPTSP